MLASLPLFLTLSAFWILRMQITEILAVAPTPLLLIVLYALHKFDRRLVRVETILEDIEK